MEIELTKIADEFCWSLYEGCVCGLDRGHECLHQCPAENHTDEWTDEQAAAWEAEMRATYRPRYIRFTHPFGFRSGEWAEITGKVTINGRDCHSVRFLDGVTDSWPIVDPVAGYEFC